jgi:hypothetical protein
MTDTELSKLITKNENTSELGEYWQKRYEKFLKTKYFIIHEKTMEVILAQNPVLSPITPFGHFDLTKFVSKNRSVDEVSLQNTIETAIRFLDSSLDVINFSPEAKEMVTAYRKIGVGVMNFNTYLEMRGSTSEIDEIDYLGNIISSSCYRVSENLAEEKGVCKNWASINKIIRPKVFEYWFDRNSGEVKNGLDINEDFTPQTIALSYYEIIPRRNSNILLYPQDIEWQIWADRDDSVNIDTSANQSNTQAVVNSSDDNNSDNSNDSAQDRANKAAKIPVNPINSLIDQSRKKISQWFGVGDKEDELNGYSQEDNQLDNSQSSQTSQNNFSVEGNLDESKMDESKNLIAEPTDLPKTFEPNSVEDQIQPLQQENKEEKIPTQVITEATTLVQVADEVSLEDMVHNEIDAPIVEKYGSTSKTFDTNSQTNSDNEVNAELNNWSQDNSSSIETQATEQQSVNLESETTFEPTVEMVAATINVPSVNSVLPTNIQLPQPLPNVNLSNSENVDDSPVKKIQITPLIVQPRNSVSTNSNKEELKSTKSSVSFKPIFSPRQIVKITNNQSPLFGQLFQVADVQYNPSSQSYQISLDSQDAIICKESELVSVDLKSLEKELANRPEVSVQAVILADDGSQVLVDTESKNLPQTPLKIGKNPEAEMSLFLAKKYNLHSDFVEVSTINFENGNLHIVYHVKLTTLDEVKDLQWVELNQIQISSAKVTLDKIIDKIRRWQSSANQKAAQIIDSTLPLEIAKAETRFVLEYEKKTAEYRFALEADASKVRTDCEAQIRSIQSLLNNSKLTQEMAEKNLLSLTADYKSLVSEKNSLIERLTTLEESTTTQISRLEQERKQAIEAAHVKTLNPLPIPNLDNSEIENPYNPKNSIFASSLVPKAIIPTQTSNVSQMNSSASLAQIMSSGTIPAQPQSPTFLASTQNEDSVSILLKMKKVNSKY